MRTSILIHQKFDNRAQAHQSSRLRKVILTGLAVRLMITPLPVLAADQVGLTSDDLEPSSTIPLVTTGAIDKVDFNQAALSEEAAPLFRVSETQLAPVSVGKSRQTEKEEAEVAEKAAAEAARIEKARIAAAEAAAKSVGSVRSKADYDALFVQYFGAQAAIAKAICTAESGLNPTAVSRTHDYGLCQINAVHRKRVGGDVSKLFDPETNIRVAADIYRDNGGWHPWTVYRTGAYKRYLP